MAAALPRLVRLSNASLTREGAWGRNKLKSVIFLTGHTHIRAYAALDPRAISMESGKYLDTVGLLGCSTTVSIPPSPLPRRQSPPSTISAPHNAPVHPLLVSFSLSLPMT